MKQLIFLSILASSWLMNGCQKVDLPDANTPVFSLNGSLDGQPLDWQAGVRERYMLADFSFVFDGKLAYRADLGIVNTAFDNSPDKIVILFVQSEKDSVSIDVNKTIKNGAFPFATSSNSGATTFHSELAYSTTISGVFPIQELTFTMGNFFKPQLPIEGFLPVIDSTYMGPATIEVYDEVGQSSTQMFYIDLPGNKVSGVYLTQEGQLLTAHLFGDVPSQPKFIWAGNPVGDSTIVMDSTFFPPIYQVSVNIGNNRVVSNSIDFSKSQDQPCNVRMDLQQIFVPDSIAQTVRNFENGSVIVQYIDKDGQLFSSDFIDQQADSFFKINKVEEYEINEAGNPTKKLDVEFNCQLMNGSRTLTKTLTNIKGVIAVGYPK